MSAAKPRRRANDKAAGVGAGIDIYGGPVIDPTKNVLDALDTAISRLDDLRIETNTRVLDSVDHLAEIQKLHATYNEKIGDLRDRHAKEIREMQAANLATTADQAQRAIMALAETSTATNARMNERIGDLEKSSNIGTGRGTGVNTIGTVLFAVTMALIGIGGVIVAVMKY